MSVFCRLSPKRRDDERQITVRLLDYAQGRATARPAHPGAWCSSVADSHGLRWRDDCRGCADTTDVAAHPAGAPTGSRRPGSRPAFRDKWHEEGDRRHDLILRCARPGHCAFEARESLARRAGLLRRLAEADQIGQQLVRAVGAGGKLPPQPEAHVDPAALADARFDKRATLRARVEREGSSSDRDRCTAGPARRGNRGRAPAPSRPRRRSPIRFGNVNTGCAGSSTFTGAVSSVTRSR